MSTYAVITGDIVKSQDIKEDKRRLLIKSLKNAFKDINKAYLHEPKAPFEIFSGDSFQAIIKKPELALRISILLRAKLRSTLSSSEPTEKPILYPYRKNWDARIAIGIGSVDFNSKKIVESDGQAFQFSGKLLDDIKKTNYRLKVQTPWNDVNMELEVGCSFADSIISEWSTYQAEAIYLYLMNELPQTFLAEKLGIAQPSFRKRLITGKAESLNLFINRFEKLILSKQ